MTIKSVTREDIEQQVKLLSKAAEEMQAIADYMKKNNLEVVKCHWDTIKNTYIPQVRRFLRGMSAKAKDQVESREEGVKSDADFQIEKSIKDSRTSRKAEMLEESIQQRIDDSIKKAIEEKIRQGELVQPPKRMAKKKGGQ